MKFSYKAFDKAGKAAAATIDAAGADEAREILRRQGFFVTHLDAQKGDNAPAEGPSRAAGSTGKVGAGKRLKFLTTYARQLHVLISSGTPIVQALSAIERQVEHAQWKRVAQAIRERVETGVPLSHAMNEHPRYFDAVCRSLVQAGETSGALGPMLERLAVLTRKQSHLRSTIVGAMVYPCLLCALGVSVVVLMLLFVLPRFAGLFANLDSPLPPSTKFLLFLSEGLQNYWWVIVPALVGAGWGAKKWLGSARGKQKIDELLLRAPKIGKLTRSLITARLSRMLGVLLESRVPLLEALGLTRQAAINIRYADLIARAEDAVSRGETISSILGNTDLINPAVQEALRNGEQSGKLGQPLVQMADFLDEENEVVIKALTTLLEPAILVVLGAIVGLMALSMFLPLFDLVSAASGGDK